MNAENVLIVCSVLIATFALGFLSAFYRIYNNRNMKLFILLFFIYYIQKLVTLFEIVSRHQQQSVEIIYVVSSVAYELLNVCFFALFLFFLYQAFSITLKKKILIIAIFTYAFPWMLKLLLSIFRINEESPSMLLLLNVDTLPFLAFFLIVGYSEYHKLKTSSIKSLAKITLLIIAMASAVILLDGILETYFNVDIPKQPVIIISYSLLSIVYCYLYSKFMKASDMSVKDDFISRFGISTREKEIVEMLIKGYSYRNISSMLYISLSTVKTHVHNIYSKTNLKSRNELVHAVLET